MVNHFKEYGYSITAKVLTRDKAKVIDLLLPDDDDDNYYYGPDSEKIKKKKSK